MNEESGSGFSLLSAICPARIATRSVAGGYLLFHSSLLGKNDSPYALLARRLSHSIDRGSRMEGNGSARIEERLFASIRDYG
jgi:hypothetical protein